MLLPPANLSKPNDSYSEMAAVLSVSTRSIMALGLLSSMALAGDVSFQHHFLLLGFKLCLFRQQKIMEEVVGGIIDEIRLAVFVVILKEGQRPRYDLRACPAHPTDCSAFLPGC